jgi:hypothetical protein
MQAINEAALEARFIDGGRANVRVFERMKMDWPKRAQLECPGANLRWMGLR